jgi:hypothetical protein
VLNQVMAARLWGCFGGQDCIACAFLCGFEQPAPAALLIDMAALDQQIRISGVELGLGVSGMPAWLLARLLNCNRTQSRFVG